MMIYGIIMGLLSALGLAAIGTTMDSYAEMGIEVSSGYMYVEAITATGVNFVVAYAGNQVRNYQRSGVMTGLYAIGVMLAVQLIGTLIVRRCDGRDGRRQCCRGSHGRYWRILQRLLCCYMRPFGGSTNSGLCRLLGMISAAC